MSPNETTAQAIAAHHAETVARLDAYVCELGRAIVAGEPWQVPRDVVRIYVDSELMPHAAAEKSTLYAEAQADPAVGLLAASMLSEHRALVRWRDALDRARDPADALLAAGAFGALFAEHAAKEDRWLLPPLAGRPDVDLEALLGSRRKAMAGT